MILKTASLKNQFCSILLLTLIFFSRQAQSNNYIIQQVDPNYPVEKLKGKGIEVRTVNEIPPSMNTLEDLRKVLKDCDLEKETASFDAVDIDVLFLRVKHLEVTELQKKYPTFNEKKLQMLKEKTL